MCDNIVTFLQQYINSRHWNGTVQSEDGTGSSGCDGCVLHNELTSLCVFVSSSTCSSRSVRAAG